MEFYKACKNGHIDIVKSMIDSGVNDLDYGLYSACKGGHMDIVKLMIEKGSNKWNLGLYGACTCEHIDIVRYGGGRINIINLMIGKGADCNDEQLVDFKKPKKFNGLNENIIRFILKKY